MRPAVIPWNHYTILILPMLKVNTGKRPLFVPAVINDLCDEYIVQPDFLDVTLRHIQLYSLNPDEDSQP